jgi:DeoR/GlpR family transcriptional regulator of sugar metabolism
MREVRHAQILNILGQEGYVKVDSLSERLGVSKVTIRSDLEYLERLGKLRRVRGGATCVEGTHVSLPYSVREGLLSTEKMQLGSRAVQLIESGDTILLDASSTVHALARELRRRTDLTHVTVITNAMPVTQELLQCPHVQLICTGGIGHAANDCFVGPLTEETLRTFRANKAFISPTSILLTSGLVDSDLFSASIRKIMIEIADQLIVLCDHSKLDVANPFPIAPLDRVTTFVTDRPLPDKWAHTFERQGTAVLLSTSPGPTASRSP